MYNINTMSKLDSKIKNKNNVIHFKAKLSEIKNNNKDSQNDALITLQKDKSLLLPSRGMNMIEGLVNEIKFRVLLEPDGNGSHWFIIDKKFQKIANIYIGNTYDFKIKLIKEYPEPIIPKDVKKALESDPVAFNLWNNITPMARWDWIQWIELPKLNKTREERPTKLISILRSGKSRPCCFNRTLSTQPKIVEIL